VQIVLAHIDRLIWRMRHSLEMLVVILGCEWRDGSPVGVVADRTRIERQSVDPSVLTLAASEYRSKMGLASALHDAKREIVLGSPSRMSLAAAEKLISLSEQALVSERDLLPSPAPSPPEQQYERAAAVSAIGVASALLLVVGGGAFKYAQVLNYVAPLVCSFVCLLFFLLFCGVVLSPALVGRAAPWFRRRLPIIWVRFVAVAPLAFLLNDWMSSEALCAQRNAKMGEGVSFLIITCTFVAIGAFTATLPLPRRRSARHLTMMALASGVHMTVLASITGHWLLNLEILAVTTIPCAFGFTALSTRPFPPAAVALSEPLPPLQQPY